MRRACLPFSRLPGLLSLVLCALAQSASAGAQRPQLNEAPVPPAIQLDEAPAAPALQETSVVRRSIRNTPAAEATTPTGFSLDPSRREASRIFYRTVYASSEGVPSGWNGDVPTGNAGTTTAEFKDAVQRRVNYFRAMAGVSGSIAFDSAFSAKCQQAALMMSANNALSHAPPSTWTDYTADGAEAAGKSDIFLGYYGPDAITGYIEDFGSPNAAVGHRRWIFYPQTKTMGTGDVPPDDSYNSANALWVVTSDFGTTRPAVRDEFVAWPPPGYVPYQLVFPRWSLSYPGANFDNATVTMKKGSASVPVTIQSRGAGAGENTIAWVWNGLDTDDPMPFPSPPADDTPVQVSVKGVVIDNQTRDFSYTVTIFDPRVGDANTDLSIVTGSTDLAPNSAAIYTSDPVANASALQFRTALLTPLTATEGAENGTANITVDVPAGYPIISSAFHASGANSFHFTTPDFVRESITFKSTVLLTANSKLSFKSRFAYATPEQVARVFVSPDEGVTWDTLYTEKGTRSPASSFTTQTISMADYANRTVIVRISFGFEDNGTGEAYTDTADNIGWYIDDIGVSDAQELSNITLGSVGTSQTYNFTPAAVGNYLVQARGQFFGNYLFEWGPALTVAVSSSAPKITTQPAGLTASAGASVQLSTAATGPGPLSYQWFHGDQMISGATLATLSLTDLSADDAGSYHVEVANSFGTTPSNTVTLTVTVPKPTATTGDGIPMSETAVQLNGRVEVHGQTVALGFQYGPTATFGSITGAGTASQPGDFAATIASISKIYYRAYAETSGGTRYYGATRTVAPLAQAAALNINISPGGGGTVGGAPNGTVRVGDAIALTAQPASGFAFTGWSGGLTRTTAALAFKMPASMTLVANFSSSPIIKGAGLFRGLALANPVAHATSGLVTVTIGAKGAFSGAVTLGGVRYAFLGVFTADGAAHFGAATEKMFARAGKEPLLLRLSLPTGNIAPGSVSGDVRDSTFTTAFELPRAVFSSAKAPVTPLRNPPPTWPGPYTADFTLNGSTPVANLDGRGWATVSVSKAGGASFSGVLADGTRWSSTQGLAEDGSVPIFASLYGGKGSLLGEVQFSGSPVTLDSTVNWFRPANLPGSRFTTGWPDGVQLTLSGSAWTPYKAKVSWPLPGLANTSGNAQLSISGGGLATGIDWTATFALATGKAVVTPTGSGATATFNMTSATGAFTGSYKPSPAGTAVSFSGVLGAGSNSARGFFLTPAGSGDIHLQPQ